MTEPDDRLPPDQRAVLSLVLERRKSYAEVASMLSIAEATVRERAHAALDTLARGDLAGTPATATAARGSGPAPPKPASALAAPERPAGASPRPSRPAPGSRAGGAALLAAIAVVAIVAVVLLSGGGKGSSGKVASTGATHAAGSGSTAASSAAKPRIDKRLTLSPAEPESHAAGEAYVLSAGSRRAFYVAAKGLEPSAHGFFYAVWLYNSPSNSAPLGRAPAVGSNGRLEGGGPLPSNARDYARIVVTRERSTHARRPGTIVLNGAFALR